ncbi:MAG: hypothetical protein HQL96_14820 [Magnetococcales bacterium]|nr:hypothetical protein [Magnetococcales bacterium]
MNRNRLPQALLGRRGVRMVINLSLIALLAYDLADATWKVLTPDPPPDSPPVAPQTTPAMPATTDPALFRGLFGSTAPATPTPTRPEEAPATRLQLNLLGIFHVDGSSGTARALIATPDAKERVLAVGESAGEAVIRAIHPDLVILEHRGRLETLRLPRKELVLEPPATTPDAEAQAAINALWSRFREKPETLLQTLRIEPALENGRFAGMRLLAGQDGALLEKLGLQTGDRIIRVNDVELTDPSRGMAVLGTLATATSLRFQVMRGEKMLSFEWQRPP